MLIISRPCSNLSELLAQVRLAALHFPFLPGTMLFNDIFSFQILNFYVVPTHLRMMYINGVTLVWNTFMSFMKHKVYNDDTVLTFML